MVDLKLPNAMEIIVLALAGGLVFLLLTFLTGIVTGVVGGLSGIIVPILLLVVFLSFAAKAKVDDLNIARLAVLLVGIAVVGTVVEMGFPGFGLVLPTEGVFADAQTLMLVLTSLTVGQVGARMVGLQ